MAAPFPPPPASPKSPSRWSLAWAAAGVGVFILVNIALLFDRCTTNEFMVDCHGGSGRHTVLVLVIAGIVVGLGATGRAGRSFAVAFFAALMGLSILTAGGCTVAWRDPVVAIRRATLPDQRRRQNARRAVAMRQSWIDAMNGRAPDVRRGVELAASVARCARDYASAHGGQVAADETHLLATCKSLTVTSASTDSGPPDRYAVPVPLGKGPSGEQTYEHNGDAGWRWRYRADSLGGFLIDVAPDAQLEQQWPRISVDAQARIGILPAGGASAMPVSPVADLRAMSACLARLPTQSGRGHANYQWHLTSVMRELCPELSPRLASAQPSDSNVALLSVQLLLGAEGAATTVAIYRVEFVQLEPHDGRFRFHLRADGTTGRPHYLATPGMLHYLATSEGAVHVTTDPRAATVNDPQID
jgi:hypothetical protein